MNKRILALFASICTLGAAVPAMGRSTNSKVRHYAKSLYNGIERMRLLVAAGASLVAHTGSRWRTALHAAAKKGILANVLYLLNNGAKATLNARDKHGKTALILAARHGRFEVVKLLLAHGADRSIRDLKGRTALEHAARKGYGAIVELLQS